MPDYGCVEFLWERLRRVTQPIVLYGMGNGAEEILARCEAEGITVSAIFASDEFVRGQSFRGFKVERYEEVVARYGDNFIILIAFASELPEILQRFRTLSGRHEVYAPHVALFRGEEIVSRAWLTEHQRELSDARQCFADEWSKRVFDGTILYKTTGKLDYIWECESERADDTRQLLTFGPEEVFLDGGAYNGDTIKEFREQVGGAYRQIIAFEPDEKNARKLTEFVAQQVPCCQVVNKALWSNEEELSFAKRGGRMSALSPTGKVTVAATTLDAYASCCPSYIKLDVEGAEREVLLGGRHVLREFAPQLLIAAYHHDADIYTLPLLLRELVPDYNIYLRKHPYVPWWELNIYATKKTKKDFS